MQNFSVFPRESSGKKYFYVSYRNADTGRQLSAKSIDSLAKLMGNEKHISKKTEACEIAQKALEAGLIIEQKNEDTRALKTTLFWTCRVKRLQRLVLQHFV